MFPPPPLPPPTPEGVLPPGEHEQTLEQIAQSYLVTGAGLDRPDWDSLWRGELVRNLAIVVHQLWSVKIVGIYVNGSFVELKAHPNDLDIYFECERIAFEYDQLDSLRAIEPAWTWARDKLTKDPTTGKLKPPFWHKYHIDALPYWPGTHTEIIDQNGQAISIPEGFRRTREGKPKGIIKIVKGGTP
jgi:hypothetical protein